VWALKKSTSNFGNLSNRRGTSTNIPLIEPLENRRLLSADPAVVFAGLPPAALKAEGKTRIPLRVANDGDAIAAGAGKVEVFASEDANLDDGDFLLGSLNKRFKVKPTKGTSVKVPVSALKGLPSGDYQLIARLSGNVAASDVNAANNQATAPSLTRVEERFVDLAAGFPAIAIQPTEGGANKISVAAANLGNITARGQVQVSLYLSSDTTLNDGDMLIAAPPAKRARMAPSRSQLFNTNVILPSNTPLGAYHVIAKIVSGGGITDVNAANDVAVAGQTVDVVNQAQAPQPHEDDDGAPDVVVVEYVIPVVVPVGGYYGSDSDDGTAVGMPDDGSSDNGQPIEVPPEYDQDPQPDPTPVYNPPTQPPAQYDPPTTQPEPSPQPPATQPVIDEPPPPVDTNYNSSGGDF